MAGADEQLNRLLRAYRTACPDPEPGPDFTPGMWRKIESRRRFSSALRRWTSAFVTAAAALCVAMAVYTRLPTAAESAIYNTTYVDALQSDNLETLAYAELVSFEQ